MMAAAVSAVVNGDRIERFAASYAKPACTRKNLVRVVGAIAASTESSASEKDWVRSIFAAIAPGSGVSY